MCWTLIKGEKEIITYKEGTYQINFSEENEQYEAEIKKLANAVSVDKIDEDMLIALVKLLRQQKHGTIAIVSNNRKKSDSEEFEIERLCGKNRGIYLTSEFVCSKNEEGKMEWNNEQLLSLTGVDGALFMDLQGNCSAFSVLLDGEAKVKGDVGRGARYNSVVNYIKQKPKKEVYIGIIISEDGMIDIVNNQGV